MNNRVSDYEACGRHDEETVTVGWSKELLAPRRASLDPLGIDTCIDFLHFEL
jgi:hypothetical protein